MHSTHERLYPPASGLVERRYWEVGQPAAVSAPPANDVPALLEGQLRWREECPSDPTCTTDSVWRVSRRSAQRQRIYCWRKFSSTIPASVSLSLKLARPPRFFTLLFPLRSIDFLSS